MSHPLLDRLSEPKVRWWIAGGVAVLALTLGGFALTNRGAADAESATGPALNIAVVPPVEREVQPGDVMDVGALNNGFDGRMPEPVPSEQPDFYAEQPAYVEDDWRADDREPPEYNDRGYDDRPRYEDPAPRQDDRRDDYQHRPLAFGFDAPRPDWRAEREARRAAMEARMEARARDDADRRVYSSSGGRLSRESEFY